MTTDWELIESLRKRNAELEAGLLEVRFLSVGMAGRIVDFMDRTTEANAVHAVDEGSTKLLRDTTAMLNAAIRICRGCDPTTHQQDIELWAEQVKVNMVALAGQRRTDRAVDDALDICQRDLATALNRLTAIHNIAEPLRREIDRVGWPWTAEWPTLAGKLRNLLAAIDGDATP